MVGSNALPVGYTTGAVLIAAAVSAIWVSGSVADHDGNVRVVDILIHDHMVTAVCVSKVHKVLIVFTVVAGQKAIGIELVEKILAKNLLHLSFCSPWMEAVGDYEENILLLYTNAVKLVKDTAHGHLSVASWLATTLHDVRDDDGDLASLVGKLSDCRHSDRVSDRLHGCRIQGIPVLWKWLGILDCLSRNKDVGVVWQYCRHGSFAVLEIQLHFVPPRYVLMMSMYSSG